MEEFEEMKGYVEHVTITRDNAGAEGEFDSSTNINIVPISTCTNTEYLTTYTNTSQGESNPETESPQKMDIITQACQMASLSPFKQPSTTTRSPSLLFSPQTSALYHQMLEISEQYSSANTPESSNQRLVDFTSLNDPIQTEFQPRTAMMPTIRNVFPGQFEQRYTDPRLLRLPAVRGFFYPPLPPTKIHQVTNNDLIRTIHDNTNMSNYVGTSLNDHEHINVPPNVTVSVNSQIPMSEASSAIFESCLSEHSSFYTDHASISTNEIVNPTETQKLVLPSKSGSESSQHHRSFLHRLMAGSETAKTGTQEAPEEPTKNQPPFLDKLIETSKKKKGKRNKFPPKRSISSQQNKVTKNTQNQKECMSDKPISDVNVIWSRPSNTMQNQPSDCEAIELSSVSRSSNSEEETFLGRLRKKTKTSVVLKPIQCKLCNKRVSRSSYLKIHMKLHNKTEQHQTSNTSGKLIDHVSQHNVQKLYKCNVCSKTYRHQGAFIFHKRIHTPKGEIRANHSTSKENERTTKRTKIDVKIIPKTHKMVACSFCKKKFSRSNYLNIHKRIHTGETPFTCQFCEKKFKYKRTYVEHVAAHKNIKLYECEICGKNYGRQSAFDVHRRNHKKKGEIANLTSAGKTTAPGVTPQVDISPLSSLESTDRLKKKPPLKRLNDVLSEEDTITKAIKSKQLFEKIGSKLKCLVCGKIFIKQHLLNIHLKGHELNISRNESYTCSHCAEDVSSISHLKDHVTKHALEIFEKSINSRKEFPLNEMNNPSSIRQDNKKDVGDSSDEILTIRFEDNEKNKPLRKRRRKIEEMIAENLISPAKPKNRARKRKATTPTKLINVNNAEEKYEAQNDDPEDEVPLFAADAADDDCEEEEDDNKSEKTIHTVKEQHRNRNKSEKCESLICLVCGQQMANSTSLRVHMRIHPRSKLICDKCGREYKYEHYLRKHMESHDSNEDSTRKRDLKVTCEECHKCIRYDCLKSHMRTHTGERPFQCDQCGATFKQITHLKMHLKIHSGDKPYQCLECGKVFRKTGNLVVHMRNHTGERPYVCDQCGLTFKHLALYKEHLASHKGIILYQCDICGHKYKSRSGYDSHRRRHHLQDLTYKCFCCGVIYQSAQGVKNCECFALKNRSTEENMEHPIGFSKIAESLSESNAPPQPQASSNINQLELSNPISSVYSSMMDMLNDHIPDESANELMLIGHPYQQQPQ